MPQNAIKTLEIPLPTKISANAVYSGMHWAKRKQLADDFHLAVWAAVKQTKFEPMKKYPIELSFLFMLKGRLLDISNLFLMTKLLEDGLKNTGIIQDDSPKYVGAISVGTLSGEANKCLVAFLDL